MDKIKKLQQSSNEATSRAESLEIQNKDLNEQLEALRKDKD